jgi:hypothetical protein
LRKEKQKMKKLSESRLRQIIKEELTQEFENANQIDGAEFESDQQSYVDDRKEIENNINQILVKLKELEKNAESSGQPLNEFFPAVLRGGLMGLGALGLADVDGDDISDAGGRIGDIVSGEEDVNWSGLGDGAEIWFKKMMIQKILSVFRIDGRLNSLLSNALVKRSFNDIKELIITRDCAMFVEFTWDAILQWIVELIADPLARASNTILRGAPMLRALASSNAYGANISSIFLGGLGAQEMMLHFQEDEDVKRFMDDQAKPAFCDFIEEQMSGFSASDVTAGILRLL